MKPSNQRKWETAMEEVDRIKRKDKRDKYDKDEIIKYRGKFYFNSEKDGTSYYLENNGLSEGLWGCPTNVNKTPDTGIGVQGYVYDFDIPPSHERIALIIKELSIRLYLEKELSSRVRKISG